jgi:branched-chain amino acid transport system ATP-binding protein
METVMSISQKVVLLVQGAVVTTGAPEEVRSSPAMLEAYLGKKHSA